MPPLRLKAKIESILLIVGSEGVSLKRLREILGQDESAIRQTLSELAQDYGSHGIRILQKGDEWQFGTAPEENKTVEDLIKSEFAESLSRASLEVLATIAYKGPITRAEVEHIRGVNSSFSIRSLLLRGLVERIENPKDARSYLYKISFDFLKHLGIEKVENLPEWDEYHKTAIAVPDTEKPEIALTS
ncbi:MAG: SMC-Scp complex subunit ScpB [Candidatus Sungbacteria bacterium RIFCSPLOWO2_02_FULL_48_13b]|uniref:SMC-Scp complex subunit ScpB n=2 Tax=Candidatus Sungiibacteriota TaxID=1817917 RepID=A0A1G2LIP6_9BACT|nr:MAG: SMC-Scp complex subunit ScpB [Candidatus Sungbacteria bacterium RIFCSPHIGHO2_02_FULL_49_20]OHA11507.1 MAG: SMC-Scp complex subunit ScpB [Candidatus Sungbacteria bacterium RIFCSPLOWO2_02_FULL_48_13b]